ncbi:MAG TPA: DUF4255 domain-containing protein [Luteitalea sp.]|nr:DUF4255 domain-containing protein [Luteitalea sp.]
MSQAAAIAGVTLSLKTLLETAFKQRGAEDRVLADVLVTTLPLDRARTVHHRCQANLTLATVQANAASRAGGPIGLRGAAARESDPASVVDLLYLVTAYGAEDDELGAQRVMGVAIGALHAQPVLPSIVLDEVFPHSGSTGTLEQLRVTQAPLSREQIVAWWLAFQTPYRLSSAWQVTNVTL